MCLTHIYNPPQNWGEVTWLKIELADLIDKNDHRPTGYLHKKGSGLPYPMKGVRLRQGFYSMSYRRDLTRGVGGFIHWMAEVRARIKINHYRVALCFSVYTRVYLKQKLETTNPVIPMLRRQYSINRFNSQRITHPHKPPISRALSRFFIIIKTQ